MTTLFVVALVTIVVISFFLMVDVAQRSSKFHEDSSDLQNLKDTVTSLALGQIRESTTRDDEIWVSQPGAIRTFNESSGERSRIYKLYSDENMILDAAAISNSAQLNLADDVPPDWEEFPNRFVDLNRPVASMSDGELHFPVVDPRVYDGRTGTGSETPEGFSYQKTHAIGGGSIAGVFGPQDVDHPNDQRVPMPVQWIYVLRDGSMGTLDSGGEFVPFAGATGASSENPMVGRFAFWTDDECSKLNLNTASEAIPWDTPKAATPEDIEFAENPPVRNEVQRFGGHPAATSLSSVFFPNEDLDPESHQARYRAIYDLVPRVNGGGYIDGKSKEAVAFDTDRLYANVEEALLTPDREENSLFGLGRNSRLSRTRFFLTANSRAPEVTASGTPRICLWPVSWRRDGSFRTAFDQLIAFNSLLNGRPYNFRRHGALTNIGEYNQFYVKPGPDPLSFGLSSNADLIQYMLRMGEETKLGYPISFEEKYGRQNLATGAIGFTEYMRQTNLHDTTTSVSGNPVVPYARGWNNFAWGTEIHGQVTNIGRNSLPVWLRNELGGSSGQISGIGTNGIGRIYVASEAGFAFCLAAEHRPDGTKINPDLVEKLNLPSGYKAIQGASLFEGFNPAQGYTMIAPSSSARFWNTQNIRIRTSEGIRAPGGEVTDATNLVQASLPLWGQNSRGNEGGMLHTPIFLRNKSPGDSPGESRYSEANWWIGWGGSGGRWAYAGSDSNNDSHLNGWRPPAGGSDFDDPSRRLINQYSRGFFLVPSADDSIELVINGTRKEVWFALGNQRNGDWAGHVTRVAVPEGMRFPVPEEPSERSFTWGQRYVDARQDGFKNPEIIDPNDVLRTWVSRHGDHRLQYIRERENSIPANEYLFVPHPDWDPEQPIADAETIKQIHSFTLPGGVPEPGATFRRGLVAGVDYADAIVPDFTIDPDRDDTFDANRPSGYPYSLDPSETRDWDNGTGIAPDGSYWNKVDDVAQVSFGNEPPYFTRQVWDGSTPDGRDETSAPNQQVPSGAIFGSINSAAASGLQWTTYLFRPEITDGGHLGARDRTVQGDRTGAPPDHAMLDWFWMPIVQPYAISERFSTAGKINMNYRIAPFSYIRRATGLHAAFKSERLLAIPASAGQTYKDLGRASSNTGWRKRIDAEETLKQFEEKFDEGEFFRTESEICEQFLVPRGESLSGMETFWEDHRLTGDNTMERPYANLYPRLTTKSNVFRVHMIAQTLRKSRTSDPTRFDPDLDTSVGEYRGEVLVERAIDPNDTEIPDYIEEPDAPRLDQFYQYRILYTRRFAP